jgi:integrase
MVMSVRQRRWYSRSDAQERAKELAEKAGREEFWREYLDGAKEQLKADPPRSAWIVHYRQGEKPDGTPLWHIATFKRKKDAEAYHDKVRVDVREGIHVAPSKSIAVSEAGRLWIEAGERAGLERTTLDTYRQHLNFHIVPFLGSRKLSALTIAVVREFEDKLRANERSPVMLKRVLISLGSLLADAQERGLVAQNVVRSLRRGRRGRKDQQARRQNGKLKVGVDIPSPEEIKLIIGHLEGRWRPLILVAIFTGVRASELRGLRWTDVDLKRAELHIRQRADRYSKIGPPKSAAGERTIPLPPDIVKILREWKLQCPKGELDLVFPNGSGNVENHSNILNRGFFPAQIAAGVVVPAKDEDGKRLKDENGKPIMTAKYTGLHSLRHFFASWCINRKQDGGLELPLKLVQERLGHATIVLTSDRYGHLFPRGDDNSELTTATAGYFA